MYTAVLVDDMPVALQVLENDLKQHCPQIEIVGKAQSIVEAAKILSTKTPDIIFLDIMLGDGTGFDLLEIFPNLSAKLIFITATDEFAIKAFRFAAIDYLLKPLNSDHLVSAVEKATKMLSPSTESIDLLKETINNPNQLPKRISLHALDRITVVEISKIIRCEADGNNTIFHVEDMDKIFVTKTLKSYDQLFANHNFMRVHQSHLIHIDYIKEYVRTEGGYLSMTNGDLVPVAVRKKAAVMAMLDNL